MDDIEQFESNNEVSVFVYSLKNDAVYREKIGNPDYVTKDVVYLLRIENEEKSHYIYIKHLPRFINFNYNGQNKDKTFCPFCEKPFSEDINEHVKKCYKLHFNEGSIVKLPEPNTYMGFKNHRNKLTRPFIIYADTESTLKKTGDDKKVHEHIINSCCFYFICNFDSSRNELFTYEGEDCLKKMVSKMSEMASECVQELKINKTMTFTPKL